MKATAYLLVCLTAFALRAFAQTLPARPLTPGPTPPPGPAFSDRLQNIVRAADATPAPALTKFSLDFPGGTPKQLVAAIEKASGRPLNALIAEEHANTKLPPFKMTDVTVPQLFEALVKMSHRRDNNGNVIGSYGFLTDDRPSEESIWRFNVYDATKPSPTALTRFDLDFPGGTPKQLVAALQKAMGKPLNAIIPDEHADVKLPPLRMNNVTVDRLFQALESASMKREAYVQGTTFSSADSGRSVYSQMNLAYGFRTSGTPSDDSVWYFFVDKPGFPTLSPAKASRFYSLTPYLERGLTVDDITTAIQTGWKMQGDTSSPQISFHKETKLLIAVGEPNKLETIDAVLKALDTPKPKPAIDPATGLPVQKTESKAGQK